MGHPGNQTRIRGDRCATGVHAFNCSGFTLLEVLVTVAIIAALAFIASGTLTRVSEAANDSLMRSEIQEIAKAIRQFKQDTGYYPKQGPFDLDSAGGQVPITNLPAHAGATNAERQRWFYSPANFYQLITNTSPLVSTGHLLESWNVGSGRGWRGPYLHGYAEGFLDIRDGINDGTPAGNHTGDPLAGNNIPDVEGIADPFEHRAAVVGGNTLLDWSALPSTDPNSMEREVWGRPYLAFDLDAAPWLVSLGADGMYATADDIVLAVE